MTVYSSPWATTRKARGLVGKLSVVCMVDNFGNVCDDGKFINIMMNIYIILIYGNNWLTI